MSSVLFHNYLGTGWRHLILWCACVYVCTRSAKLFSPDNKFLVLALVSFMELEEHCYVLHGVVLRVKCDLVSKMLSTVSGTEQVLSSSIVLVLVLPLTLCIDMCLHI